MRDSLVTVFGGSGFIGRHLVRRLAERGARVNVAVRDTEAALYLKPMGSVGQITPIMASLRHPPSVARAVEGADVVVNLVGILYQRGAQSFDAIHARGAEVVAKAASEAGAQRLVQMSAIGADPESPAEYARSKAAGEKLTSVAFPGTTIIRPSIVFGPEDDFFNRFGAMARILPALPLIGGGETRFQPVYVGDVADAMIAVLDRPDTAGKTFELGGPRIYSFKELMEVVLQETGRKRLLLPLPFAAAKLQAAFLQLLPVPPLTIDQVKLLERDNVVGDTAAGLDDLGITPTPIHGVLPTYMFRYRRGGAKVAPRFG